MPRAAADPVNTPLRARLCWYKLSSSELTLLQAMVEHCSDGSTIWAAVPRLAAYSKLSLRTTQRTIQNFLSRGILSELAPANSAKRRPATYRLNEAALEPDPKMRRYINRQLRLPGIQVQPVPGEPIPDRTQADAAAAGGTGVMVTPDVMVTGDWCHGDGGLVSPRRGTGVMVSPNTKAFDPLGDPLFDPKTAGFFLSKQSGTPQAHAPPQPIPPKIADRNERDRRARLAEATQKGMRDFTKHPLEEWEKTG